MRQYFVSIDNLPNLPFLNRGLDYVNINCMPNTHTFLQRDAYESRARYLAHIQAMAPLINLPPVSVPSELFQSALSRAGIFLDSPEDLKNSHVMKSKH